MNDFGIVTILSQGSGDLPRHRDFVFNNQDLHGFSPTLDA
jgi:hypothetical protein